MDDADYGPDFQSTFLGFYSKDWYAMYLKLDMPFGWNMLCAKTDLLWVIGADTAISFFSAWAHETFLIWLSHVIVYLFLNTLKSILLF